MAQALLIVLADTVGGSDDDADFITWVFNKHMPDVLSSRRFESASLYRRTSVETLPGVPLPTQRFVTVYEIEATNDQELEDASQGLRDALAAGLTDLTPTLEFASMASMYLLPVEDH